MPLTKNTPKPMLTVAGIPVTEHQIAMAKSAGITEIVLATSYLSEVFTPYFGDGSQWGIKIKYAVEKEPLGTGGAIRNAAQLLDTDQSVVVLNGDILSSHNLAEQIRQHEAHGADVTLLFYAGHGAQISGTNYMLPTDIDMNDFSQVPLTGVSLNSVVEQYLPGKTKLVFLDACRDNPLIQNGGRTASRGLAPISVAEGTLIAYATKDGQVADDGGNQRHSPFTAALLEHLRDPDDIAVVLRKVRERVLKTTGGKQQPWEYGSLTGGSLVLSAIRPPARRD
jgi:hypothetical protein